jgi:hypothetical protein
MSNTFTAQGLADFFQKVADGGEIEFRVNCTNKQWFSTSGSPSLSSVRQDWRIKPTKKVIDLSVLIESGIDCEFSDCDFKQYTGVGSLSSILGGQTQPFVLSDAVGYNNAKYEQCRPRMNHIHAWQGDECPLPEGFRVKVWWRSGGEGDAGDAFHLDLRWSNEKRQSDIIAFEVLGLADGYVMPWEQDND